MPVLGGGGDNVAPSMLALRLSRSRDVALAGGALVCDSKGDLDDAVGALVVEEEDGLVEGV